VYRQSAGSPIPLLEEVPYRGPVRDMSHFHFRSRGPLQAYGVRATPWATPFTKHLLPPLGEFEGGKVRITTPELTLSGMRLLARAPLGCFEGSVLFFGLKTIKKQVWGYGRSRRTCFQLPRVSRARVKRPGAHVSTLSEETVWSLDFRGASFSWLNNVVIFTKNTSRYSQFVYLPTSFIT
jgi:hypothetical protein